MILTIWLTGLFVCIVYDITIYIAFGIDPSGRYGIVYRIFDYILWPISIIGGLILAIIGKKKGVDFKEGVFK